MMVALTLTPGQALAQRPGSSKSTQPVTAQEPRGDQEATRTARKSNSAARSAERLFITEAAQGGRAEVELGQLVSERATNPEVRQFGERMVQDHGKANSELMQLAQQKSITIPTELDAKHKATRNRLAGLSGEAFDRAYVQEMLIDHRKDVREFRAKATSAADPDVRAWASKTLPTLEEHLTMIEHLSGNNQTLNSRPAAPTGTGGRNRTTTGTTTGTTSGSGR
jgi:putative membrane protein